MENLLLQQAVLLQFNLVNFQSQLSEFSRNLGQSHLNTISVGGNYHCHQDAELFNNYGPGKFEISDDCSTLTIVGGDSEQGFWIPSLSLRRGQQISFNVEFSEAADDGVGRHGGIVVGDASAESNRWNTNGFVFDYIDRDDPTGYRTYGAGQGAVSEIQNYAVESRNPAKKWTIIMPISGPIIFICDSVYISSANYDDLIEGTVGFWVYSGKIAVTNLAITDI